MHLIQNNPKIHSTLQQHAKEMIVLLQRENINFSIACVTSLLDFTPSLNFDLYQKIGRVGVFVLSGYSFESIEIEEGFFEFEAGLTMSNGEDIGTIIRIPYIAILQILVQDSTIARPVPIFINPFEVEEESDMEDSIQAILSKNLHLVKH